MMYKCPSISLITILQVNEWTHRIRKEGYVLERQIKGKCLYVTWLTLHYNSLQSIESGLDILVSIKKLVFIFHP